MIVIGGLGSPAIITKGYMYAPSVLIVLLTLALGGGDGGRGIDADIDEYRDKVARAERDDAEIVELLMLIIRLGLIK